MAYNLFKTGDLLLASKLNQIVPQMISQGTDYTCTLNSTTPQLSDILFLPDTSAVYTYELFIAYSASTNSDFRWSWDASEATFSRYVTHRALTPVLSGLNTGTDAVVRRPGQATNILAQGGDAAAVTAPLNFMSAYDRGTFVTTSSPAVIALMVAQGTASATENTILRGGNATRLLYTRVG